MTSSSELHYLDAAEQAELIRTRRISPVDLVKACLARIEAHDGTLRGWISVDAERALAEARVAEAEIVRGEYRGPLHGLPYGVKDQIHALGFRTTLGSRVLRDDEMAPPADATVVAKLREAGAILLGKQNLHEFGKGGTIDFPFGQPRNPWNPAYTASSSSSGSGIAPAAGQCSFSIGEDTGGSIRGPASCNGVVGIRPTFGRVSRVGGVMHAYTTDTIGPLARSVRDAAMVLRAIAGFDAADPLSVDRPVPAYPDLTEGGIAGMKLAVVREMSSPDLLHPDVQAAFEVAVAVLRDAGAEVREISLPLAKWAVPLQLLTADADAAAFCLPYLRDRYEAFDAGTRTRMAASSLVFAGVYNRAMRARVIVRKQILDAMQGYDGLLSPANVTPPKPIADDKETTHNKDELVPRLIQRRICNYPYSLANVPAMSLPMGFSAAGLPLGLQIAAKPFDEVTMLRIARAYEKRAEWRTRKPDLDQTLKQAC